MLADVIAVVKSTVNPRTTIARNACSKAIVTAPTIVTPTLILMSTHRALASVQRMRAKCPAARSVELTMEPDFWATA